MEKFKNYHLVNIPVKLHGEFKSYCAKRNISMRKVFIQFMESITAQEGDR